MKRALVCNYLPPQYVTIVRASQAANNFCERLMEIRIFDEIYSILPISYKIPINTKSDSVTFFINGKRNIISKSFRYISLNFKAALSLRKKELIWFYNITPSFLLTYILIKFLFKKKTYIIMADYTNPSKRISLQSIIGHLIRKSDGIISLSARSCFDHHNMLIKAGIISETMLNKENYTPANKNITFLFSGLLSDITGYDMALKIFARIPKAQLYISGNGEYPQEYKKYSNIHYMGNLPYNKYLDLLDNVTICLNFRNPYKTENNNNFPSKILDYFSRGKIVISTIKYPEIQGANYFYTEYNENLLENLIRDIMQMDPLELKQYQSNKDFLKRNFSLKAWHKAINIIEKTC